MILLDTHIWIKWVNADDNLSTDERFGLDAISAHGKMVLSDISLWEAQMLSRRPDSPVIGTLEDWFERATSNDLFLIQPITPEIAIELDRLPEFFHKDPADRIITATARVLGVPLATHDRNIIDSGAVPIWQP